MQLQPEQNTITRTMEIILELKIKMHSIARHSFILKIIIAILKNVLIAQLEQNC